MTVIEATTTTRKTTAAAAAAVPTMTVANYNKKEEKEMEDEKFYSYINLVHNQSFFSYAEKINLKQFSCHILEHKLFLIPPSMVEYFL